MDDKTQIVNDLPEPKARLYSPEETGERKRKLFVTVFTVVAAYAFLHKMLIPSALSFTSLRHSPYAQLDFSFLLPGLLVSLLVFNSRHYRLTSFLAGIVVSYGAIEIWEIGRGNYIGWLFFSRLLSSVPAALLSLVLLTSRGFKRDPLSAWIGTAFFAFFHLFHSVSFLPSPQASSPFPKTVRALPTAASFDCGSREIRFSLKNLLPHPTHEITIEPCGFSPAVMHLSSSQIEIRNNLDTPINVHLLIRKKHKLATGWNVLIPPKTLLQKDLVLPPGSLGMLYSDSDVKAGIAALFAEQPKEGIIFSRTPLFIGEINGF